MRGFWEFNLFEPRWHGWAKWTAVWYEPTGPKTYFLHVVAQGWTRRKHDRRFLTFREEGRGEWFASSFWAAYWIARCDQLEDALRDVLDVVTGWGPPRTDGEMHREIKRICEGALGVTGASAPATTGEGP